MSRRLFLLFFLFVVTPLMYGQVPGVLGFPDRVMSSSRIGRVSKRDVPKIPASDPSRLLFPGPGQEYVSKDFGFFNYLMDNGLGEDAKTLSLKSYFPSDTLDFIRAKVLFSELKLSQASELFANVPFDSPFGPESFYYRVVSRSSMGDYSKVEFPEGGPYAELSALQSAGLALLRGDRDEWERSSTAFTFDDFALEESERVLTEMARDQFGSKSKHAGVAALASAVLPGAGKIYAGRVGEGVAAFLTVGSLGAITAENWKRHGGGDWRTIVAGTLCVTFYLGNIYGSYMSVSIENDERINARNAVIVYHLHLPLRTIFR